MSTSLLKPFEQTAVNGVTERGWHYYFDAIKNPLLGLNNWSSEMLRLLTVYGRQPKKQLIA